MTKPITPKVVIAKSKFAISDEVIDVFNKTIVKHWNGLYSIFSKFEIDKSVAGVDYNYVEIIELFELFGWSVTFTNSHFAFVELSDWNI